MIELDKHANIKKSISELTFCVPIILVFLAVNVLSACSACNKGSLNLLTPETTTIYSAINQTEGRWQGQLKKQIGVLPPDRAGYTHVLVMTDRDIPVLIAASMEGEVSSFEQQQVILVGKLTKPVEEGLAGPSELIYAKTIEGVCP